MKIPKTFRPDKDLDGKIEELMLKPKTPKIKKIVINNYSRIRYKTEDADWILDYGKMWEGIYAIRGEKLVHGWKLSQKPAHEIYWLDHYNYMSWKARSVLKEVLSPLIEALDLEEKDYNLEKDNCKTILEKYAWSSKEVTEDVSLYRIDNLIIELRQVNSLDIDHVVS